LTELTWNAVEKVNEPATLFVARDGLNLWVIESATLYRVGVHELRWFLTQHIDFVAEKEGHSVPKTISRSFAKF
jgi:hypothetical protein